MHGAIYLILRHKVAGQEGAELHLLNANLHEMSDMDWDNLKVVLAISRAGSLTGAAQLLGVDQSTVGRKLTAAEKDVGAILFVRAKSGFVPTQAGEITLRHAEQVENALRNMSDDISDAQSGARGTVRIVGNAWMMQELAGREVQSFFQSNPKAQFTNRMRS